MKKTVFSFIVLIFLLFYFNINTFSSPPSDWYNIKDYGAKGDDSDFDNAPIITATIKASYQTNPQGGTIYIPKGIYRIKSPIKLNWYETTYDVNKNIIKITLKDYSNIVILGAGIENTFIKNFADSNSFDGTNSNNRHILFEGFTILNAVVSENNNSRTNGDGIVISGSNLTIVSIRDVAIYGHMNGVRLGNLFKSDLIRVFSYNNKNIGIWIDGSGTSTTLINCYATSNGLYGFKIDNMNYSNLIGCASEQNIEHGYYLYGCNNISLMSCGAECNKGDQFKIHGTENTPTGYGISIISCYAIINSDDVETGFKGSTVGSGVNNINSQIFISGLNVEMYKRNANQYGVNIVSGFPEKTKTVIMNSNLPSNFEYPNGVIPSPLIISGTTITGQTEFAQYNGGTVLLTKDNATGTNRFALNNNSNGSWTMYDYYSNRWNEGITQKNGNIGIGIKEPLLDARLQIAISDGATAILAKDSVSGTNRFALNNNSDGSWTMYDYFGNGWHRGITQKNGSILVNGSLCFAGTIGPCSSKELKENIENFSIIDANRAFKDLTPVKFSYKADKEKESHLGFIAEDVPDILSTKDHKAVDMMSFIAVLTNIVKQQQQSISELKNEIETIKKQTK